MEGGDGFVSSMAFCLRSKRVDQNPGDESSNGGYDWDEEEIRMSSDDCGHLARRVWRVESGHTAEKTVCRDLDYFVEYDRSNSGYCSN